MNWAICAGSNILVQEEYVSRINSMNRGAVKGQTFVMSDTSEFRGEDWAGGGGAKGENNVWSWAWLWIQGPSEDVHFPGVLCLWL